MEVQEMAAGQTARRKTRAQHVRDAMAEAGAAAPAGKAKANGGEAKLSWFVVLRVDDVDEDGSPAVGVAPVPEGASDLLRIGERLTLIKVVQGRASEQVAREHRKAVEAEWQELRSKDGGRELPEVFPTHRYRVLAVGSFLPGYFAQETRQATFGTF